MVAEEENRSLVGCGERPGLDLSTPEPHLASEARLVQGVGSEGCVPTHHLLRQCTYDF